MDYRTVLTTCAYCGCGCGLYLEALDGRLIGTLPSKTNPINEGKLCVKGWNIHEFVQHPDRITKPLIRKNGTLTEASWDEALDYTAGKLKEIKEAHGSDSIGFLASAKVTNEENYIIMKFARAAVGTNNVDHCARLWHSSTVVGLAAAFGSGAMTNSIAEIEDADCIFVTGSNTTSSHPLVATRIFRAIAKGAKVIVADPRKIQLALQADIYVRQRLGTDVALLNGIMHAILKNNWHDKAFVEERCEGFEEFKQVIDNYPPEKVSEITGVAVDDIVKIAEYYAKAEAASIVYCMGITQHTTGVDNVKSLANLAMLTGNMGKEATGVNPLRGQNNVQGACDMGGLPNVYSGYQAVNVIDNQTKFEEAWGAKLSDQIGLTIPFMLSGLSEGKVKALYAVGENPMVSDPDVGHVEKALKKAELLVVQDIFLTPTAELAHVVLPGTSFAEKDGTFTNTERRVQLVRKAIEPIGEAKADWEIIQEVSNRFGYEMNYDSAEDIMKEISTLTPSYGGITYERLEGDGLAWPCPDKDHPGTKFLHKDKFARGLGLFHAIEYQPPAEVVDDEYPFWLSTGRVHVHYHTGTMTRVSPSLHAEMPEGILEIHPEDAQRLGVGEGEKVKVASRRGEIVAKVTLTDRVDVGVVFMPFHFAETCANVLTNPAHDPTAKIPEYKVCAVKVEKAPEEGRGQ